MLKQSLSTLLRIGNKNIQKVMRSGLDSFKNCGK